MNTLCLKKEDIFKICALILKKLLRTSQAVPPYYKAVFVFSMINGVRPQCGQPNVNLRQVPAQVND